MAASLKSETPQWGAADAEIKSHLLRTQSLKVLTLKPRVGQYIAMHATLTARDFFPCQFLRFLPIHLHFSKPLPGISRVGCG